ncbi:MAG: hypothetical protein JW702_08480 [Clostridiales bacterium]|nr:hypothetical protein [Clostridiales bacterium]
MNGLALLGIFLIIYSAAVVFIAVTKPKSIWKMGKIQFFIKVMGEKGTVIFFYFFAILALGFGVWLLIK